MKLSPEDRKCLYADVTMGWCTVTVDSDVPCPTCGGRLSVQISSERVVEKCTACDYVSEDFEGSGSPQRRSA